MAKFPVGIAFAATLLSVVLPAFSQTEPPPTPAYPNQDPALAASPAAALPPPTGQQSPTNPPPPPNQAPATGSQPAMQAPAAGPPPPAAYPTNPAATQGNTNAYNRPIAEPEPPPPPAEDMPPQGEKSFEFPDMSVRVDPLNWLIYGRLGVELEAVAWKFISVEVVPVFVTNDHPPAMNLGSFPANLYQESNGLGAMSGASIGAGFWLGRKPFEGTVLRLIYANYGYTYTVKDDNGVQQDQASHTDRRLYGFIGSHSKWGPFTIASGIGLGMELNRERRCLTKTVPFVPTTDCSKEVFDLQLARNENKVVSVYDSLHPVYLEFRLSLGFVF